MTTQILRPRGYNKYEAKSLEETIDQMETTRIRMRVPCGCQPHGGCRWHHPMEWAIVSSRDLQDRPYMYGGQWILDPDYRIENPEPRLWELPELRARLEHLRDMDKLHRGDYRGPIRAEYLQGCADELRRNFRAD